MRLEKVQKYLKEKEWEYQYHEEDECGSIDFEYRGIPYHIWEFLEDGIYGADSNVRNGGRQEEFLEDYEAEIINIIENWQ